MRAFAYVFFFSSLRRRPGARNEEGNREAILTKFRRRWSSGAEASSSVSSGNEKEKPNGRTRHGEFRGNRAKISARATRRILAGSLNQINHREERGAVLCVKGERERKRGDPRLGIEGNFLNLAYRKEISLSRSRAFENNRASVSGKLERERSSGCDSELVPDRARSVSD